MCFGALFKNTFVWILLRGFICNAWASKLQLPCTPTTTTCGRPDVQPFSTRIIGGSPAPRGSWPWMVSLFENGFASCGGAIIASDLVLTATHCFLGKDDPSVWTARVGKYRKDRDEAGQKIVQVKQLILHDQFEITTVANDIALVVLAESLNYSDVIGPICLPSADQGVQDGEMCLLAGWGSTRGTSDPNALNQLALPVIPDSTCALPDWYGQDFSQPDTTFCAGYEEGIKDGCTGDSGGPLICLREYTWYLQGISSWGYGCAERKWPGIYTEVNKYTDWIQEQVRKLRENCPANPIVG